MSLPATEQWFSLSARRNRKSFILAWMTLVLVLVAVVAALWFFDAPYRATMTIFWLFFIPYFVCGYLLTAQRLRDIGITGWLALLWIAIGFLSNELRGVATLVFVLVLCAVPGTQGPNRYGADPLES